MCCACVCVCVCLQFYSYLLCTSACWRRALAKKTQKKLTWQKPVYPECLLGRSHAQPICAQDVYLPVQKRRSVSVHRTHACVSVRERCFCAQCLLKVKHDSANILFLARIPPPFRVHKPDMGSPCRCWYLHLNLKWIFVLPGLINSSSIVYYVPRSPCFSVMTWTLGK